MPRARSKSPGAKQAGENHPLRRLFNGADQDGNGVLDLGELKMIMASLNAPVSTKQAKQMMAEADIDGDGAIDFAEFFTIMTATLHESAWSTVQDAPTKLLASIEMMKTAVEGSLEGFHRTLSAAGEPVNFVQPVPVVSVQGVFIKSQGAAVVFRQPNLCHRAIAFVVGLFAMSILYGMMGWAIAFYIMKTGHPVLAASTPWIVFMLLNILFWNNGQNSYHFLFGFQVVHDNGAPANCCGMFMRNVLTDVLPIAVFVATVAVSGGAPLAKILSTVSGFANDGNIDIDDVAQLYTMVGQTAALASLAMSIAFLWPCFSSKRRQLADECLGTQVVFKR